MLVGYYTQIGLVCNIGQQACQEPSPCLRVLAFDNGKREWINLVVTICCYCYQQLSFVFSIEVRCIYAYHRLAMPEPFNTWIERPKRKVEYTSPQDTGVTL